MKKYTAFLIIGYLVLGVVYYIHASKQPPTPPPTAPAAADWPYKTSRTLTIITTKNVILSGKPVLYVFHDSGEGNWQFLDASVPQVADITTATLEEVTKRDASLHAFIDDLPEGWAAWRDTPTGTWHKALKDETHSAKH